MFSGISCLFCVNYGHSVRTERFAQIGRLSTPEQAGQSRLSRYQGIALKRLVFWMLVTVVTAMWYIHHKSILNRRFGLGNGDFDLNVWNCWVYTAQ